MPRLIQFSIQPAEMAKLTKAIENGEIGMNHKYRLTHQKGSRRIGSVTSNNREQLERIAQTMNDRKPGMNYRVEENADQNPTTRSSSTTAPGNLRLLR